LSLAGSATAGATITKTSVTTPGSPFFAPAWNSDSGATNPSFTIAGTSDGTTGDTIDVICVRGTSYNTFASNVAVNADGSWSISADASAPSDSSCTIRAIPTGSLPPDQSPFSGPFGTFSWFIDYTLTSGANSGIQYDAFADMWGLHGHAETGSSGSSGISRQVPLYPDGSSGSKGWYASANLPRYDSITGNSRGSIQIDGQDAFNSYGAESLWNNPSPAYSYDNPGLPALSFAISVDPASGTNTSSEDEQLVTCPAGAMAPYSQSNCSSFSDAHVHFHRSVSQAAQGQLLYITDTVTSTDGLPHMVNLRYNEAFAGNSYTEFAFPGDAGLTQYNGGDVRSGPFPTLGTVQAMAYYYPTSVRYPAGSLTWDTAPDQARFRNAYDFVFDYRNRTVPASGSVTLRFAYVTASNDSDNAALTAQAQSAFAPPPPPPPVPPAKPAAKPTPAPGRPAVPRKCIVPKIAKGTKLSAAENKIQNAECIVGHIAKVHSKIKKGRVVSQTIAAGTAVPFGSPVGLGISTGPSAKHHKHGQK
jgi:hypothetical protein